VLVAVTLPLYPGSGVHPLEPPPSPAVFFVTSSSCGGLLDSESCISTPFEPCGTITHPRLGAVPATHLLTLEVTSTSCQSAEPGITATSSAPHEEACQGRLSYVTVE